MSKTLRDVAEALVENCRTGREREGLETLYAADAVSVEMSAGPGGADPVTVGVEGIKGKHDWWAANFEVHGGSVDGPYLHGKDSFAVIFEIDATDKARGQRFQMKEVAVYTLNADGRIAREAFYGRPM